MNQHRLSNESISAFCSHQQLTQHIILAQREFDRICLGYTEAPELLVSNSSIHSSTNTSQINSSFYICPICLGIASNPIETRCCKHWFCASCYMRGIETCGLFADSKCPVCRKRSTSITQSTNRLDMEMLAIYYKIPVYCRLECGFISQIRYMEKHEKEQCRKRPLTCPFPACFRIVEEEYMSKHLDECNEKLIACPSCRCPVNATQFGSHNCIQKLHEIIEWYSLKTEGMIDYIPWQNTLGERGQMFFRPISDLETKSASWLYGREKGTQPYSVEEVFQQIEKRKKLQNTGSTTKPQVQPPLPNLLNFLHRRPPSYERQNAIYPSTRIHSPLFTSRNNHGSLNAIRSSNPETWSISAQNGSDNDEESNLPLIRSVASGNSTTTTTVVSRLLTEDEDDFNFE